MLTAYKREKRRVLKQYEKILSISNIIPKSMSLEDIKEKKRQLEDEHFFVSFTGQIKAGKSTLINALLFGDEIIPSDDTPHTAKITIIKYGKEPKIEATFYNKEEWKQLRSNQDFYEEFLKPDIEKAIGNGIYEDELIYATAKVQKESDLDNLKEYVARDGKYTPFINLVTIYYPNEILKEITVVDTPGTNDPNKQRDKVAKEWIHKTNANVYITYANQAMDKVDIDFIDNFLLSVPKEQKLTVINKIDSVNDTSGLEEYIAELLSDEDLKRREVVSSRDSLILVSGLGALIDKMLNNEMTLNDDLNYYAEQLDEKGYLEPENHGLGKLEEMIEQKLIENKGKSILESHSKFLNSIFKKRIDEIEQKLREKKSSLSDLMKSKSELEATEKSIKETIKFIGQEQSKINKDFSNLVRKNMDEFEAIKINQNNIMINSVREEVKSITKTSNYKNEVIWIVKANIDNNFNALRDTVQVITDRLTQEIQKDMTNLKDKLSQRDKSISITLTSQTFNIYALELVSGMKELAEAQFKKEDINRIVKDNTNLFQRILNRGLGEIDSEIMNEVQQFFENSSNNMQNNFAEMLNQHIQEDIVKNIMIELTRIMDSKKDEIDEYIKNEKDKEHLIKRYKKDKTSLEKRLDSIKKHQREIG